MNENNTKILNSAVLISALGYFVDIYDLILFGVVANPSLAELGYQGSSLEPNKIFLLNMQMFGMLVGGILWGVLGDKKGRLSVLFGSIFVYSIANIANGMVTNIEAYAVIRFLAGVGLAGELGAGITLVNESLSKENRGIGTMIVVAFGALGAVVAAKVHDLFDWRMAYYVGGGMGLMLLVLRVSAFESGIYKKALESNVARGNFFQLFSNWETASKYLKCIMVGLPIWSIIGLLILLSPELSKYLYLTEPMKAGNTIVACYLGLSIGDVVSGMISQWWRSRRKVVILYLAMCILTILVYVNLREISAWTFYCVSFAIGFSAGYWAIFVTQASEQFGTNIRATVTTTVPNFVRGAVIPITFAYTTFAKWMNPLYSALVVNLICILLAFWSIKTLKETFGKDLDYVE